MGQNKIATQDSLRMVAHYNYLGFCLKQIRNCQQRQLCISEHQAQLDPPRRSCRSSSGGFMRLTFRWLFALFLLLCTYPVSRIVAQLQTPNGVDFRASSSFVAQNVTFPAGTYNVKPSQNDIETLVVSSADGHSAFIPCEPLDSINPAGKTELTFHRYGSSLYLKQIWVKGSTDGCLVPSGPAEKNDRKSGKPTKETVPGTAK